MKYLLMICGDESAAEHAGEGCGGWSEEMERRGVVRGGAGLAPPADATTVRVRDAEVLLTDGPFAETKEMVGGFVLIECADLDEAIEIAAKHPAAGYGTIEIRPVIDGPPPSR
ncbi:YciI family protein [Kribbella sp. CA-293567]|uniref:YciI family protein n=1 Tax=Kribbella sp. CA-293567 TaxID=3002436 RepID=UPI0022DDF76E|nr:YciI family protein [Kribbella sp. CA-293567]WBQ02069.1 YciI family protein [Kribbella sp. CA-293567]